jgi:hypothetical protein
MGSGYGLKNLMLWEQLRSFSGRDVVSGWPGHRAPAENTLARGRLHLEKGRDFPCSKVNQHVVWVGFEIISAALCWCEIDEIPHFQLGCKGETFRMTRDGRWG